MTRKLTKADFKLPALLIALSVVPTLGGIARFLSMSEGATPTPDDARFLISPTPIIIHVISATLYSLLGAFQFSPGFRVRWPGMHRRAGKLLALCGFSAAATGLWMTAFYRIPTTLQGPLLYAVRLTVAVAMIASILIAWLSILRRNVPRHEAFMIRAYALGQGAATQVLVLGPWMLISGESGGVTRDVLMTLAWVINVVVAEAIIASRGRGPGGRVASKGMVGGTAFSNMPAFSRSSAPALPSRRRSKSLPIDAMWPTTSTSCSPACAASEMRSPWASMSRRIRRSNT